MEGGVKVVREEGGGCAGGEGDGGGGCADCEDGEGGGCADGEGGEGGGCADSEGGEGDVGGVGGEGGGYADGGCAGGGCVEDSTAALTVVSMERVKSFCTRRNPNNCPHLDLFHTRHPLRTNFRRSSTNHNFQG